MEKTLQIIKTAMKMEAEGEEYYKAAAEKTKDLKGKAFFLVLAKDEKEHKKLFSDIYLSLNEEKKWMPPKTPLTKRRVSPSSIFDKKEVGGMKGDPDDINALLVAIEKEKKTIDFYRNAMDEIEDEDAKRLLLELIDIEEGHLNILNGELNALTDSGYWFDFPEFTVEGM